MKLILAAAVALAVATPALAQSGGDMNNMSGMTGTDQSSMTMADGAGVVKAVDPQAGTVTIQHGPIAALKWPAMMGGRPPNGIEMCQAGRVGPSRGDRP